MGQGVVVQSILRAGEGLPYPRHGSQSRGVGGGLARAGGLSAIPLPAVPASSPGGQDEPRIPPLNEWSL